jgi:hypothetical protein
MYTYSVLQKFKVALLLLGFLRLGRWLDACSPSRNFLSIDPVTYNLY